MVTKSTVKKEKGTSVKRVKATPEAPEENVSIPTEEEIRELAEILYHQRIGNGESGSAADDWLKAESYLQFPDN